LADAVVIATGFTLFDAHRKQEYGYGLYDNVITSVDLERMMNGGKVTLADGSEPKRIAILHCVGSRDEKVGQKHCSKVCCITGVKQAIELKEMYPTADVFNFYMDIRMFGPGYEELYREAQERYNVHFVRGRISEAAETIDKRIQIKAEDTLTGRPLRMTVDMLVLLVGMSANYDNPKLAASAGLSLAPNGYFKPKDSFLGMVHSEREGIFFAGTATAPKSLADTLAEASLTASAVDAYLKNKFNVK
jgi:heterodisulfide reductase subunit A